MPSSDHHRGPCSKKDALDDIKFEDPKHPLDDIRFLGPHNIIEDIKFENTLLRNGIFSQTIEMNYANVYDLAMKDTNSSRASTAGFEVLSIYSCAECVLHEGSNNKEHRYSCSSSNSSEDPPAKSKGSTPSANNSYLLATSNPLVLPNTDSSHKGSWLRPPDPRLGDPLATSTPVQDGTPVQSVSELFSKFQFCDSNLGESKEQENNSRSSSRSSLSLTVRLQRTMVNAMRRLGSGLLDLFGLILAAVL